MAACFNVPVVYVGKGGFPPIFDRTEAQECLAGTEILEPFPNIWHQNILRINTEPKQNTLLYLFCHNRLELISVLWNLVSLACWQRSRGTQLWFGQRALIPGYLKCNIWCHWLTHWGFREISPLASVVDALCSSFSTTCKASWIIYEVKPISYLPWQ